MSKKLLNEFNALYGGYVCIDEEVVQTYIDEVKNESFLKPEYLYDWVLANDMAFEVVE